MKTPSRLLLGAALLGLLLVSSAPAADYRPSVSRTPIRIPDGSFQGLRYRAEGEVLLDTENLRIDVLIRMNPLQAGADGAKARQTVREIIRNQVSASLAILLEDSHLDYANILEKYPAIAAGAAAYLEDAVRSVPVDMPMPNLYQAEFHMPFEGPGGIADYITSANIDRPAEADRRVASSDGVPVPEKKEQDTPAPDDETPARPDPDADVPERVDAVSVLSVAIVPPLPSPSLDSLRIPSSDRLLEGDVLELAGLLFSDMIARGLSADSSRFSVAVQSPDGASWKSYGTQEREDVPDFEADVRLSGEIVDASTANEVSGGDPYRLTFRLILSKSGTVHPLWQKEITREKRRNPSSDMDPYLELAYLMANEVMKELRAYFSANRT